MDVTSLLCLFMADGNMTLNLSWWFHYWSIFGDHGTSFAFSTSSASNQMVNPGVRFAQGWGYDELSMEGWAMIRIHLAQLSNLQWDRERTKILVYLQFARANQQHHPNQSHTNSVHLLHVRRHLILWALLRHWSVVSWCSLTVLCPPSHGDTGWPRYHPPCTKKVWRSESLVVQQHWSVQHRHCSDLSWFANT